MGDSPHLNAGYGIVYKLYGLTSDEIKIVEGSISGGHDAKETGIT